MFRKVLVFAGVSLVVALSLSGCGGSSPKLSVAVTAAASTVDGNDTTTLTATVTNDSGRGTDDLIGVPYGERQRIS